MKKQKLYLATYGSISSSPTFKLVTGDIPKPQENEVLIKHTAIGINFQDYQHYKLATTAPGASSKLQHQKTNTANVKSSNTLSMMYSAIKNRLMPNSQYSVNKANNSIVQPIPTTIVPGIEAVGIVEEIGASVKDITVGQRIGYCTATDGAYSEYRTIRSKHVFPIYDSISDEAAVTNLLKAMTAHYLMRRTFYVQPNMHILVHAGASGVGQAMIRLAKEYNAVSIATIEDDNYDTITLLKKLGCNHIINYNNSNWVQHIKSITNDKGVNVVYDCLGQQTVLQSIDCLMPFGLLVLYGEITGKVTNINPSLLTPKSLFLTAPELNRYKEDIMELLLSSLEVFALIEKGILPRKAAKVYKFTNVVDAMHDIESRKHLGPKVIVL